MTPKDSIRLNIKVARIVKHLSALVDANSKKHARLILNPIRCEIDELSKWVDTLEG